MTLSLTVILGSSFMLFDCIIYRVYFFLVVSEVSLVVKNNRVVKRKTKKATNDRPHIMVHGRFTWLGGK